MNINVEVPVRSYDIHLLVYSQTKKHHLIAIIIRIGIEEDTVITKTHSLKR